MSYWRRISSAPKDGTRLLLSNQYGVWIGMYIDVYQSGYKPENPWFSLLFNHNHIGKWFGLVPTHWMRFPEVPDDV